MLPGPSGIEPSPTGARGNHVDNFHTKQIFFISSVGNHWTCIKRRTSYLFNLPFPKLHSLFKIAHWTRISPCFGSHITIRVEFLFFLLPRECLFSLTLTHVLQQYVERVYLTSQTQFLPPIFCRPNKGTVNFSWGEIKFYSRCSDVNFFKCYCWI